MVQLFHDVKIDWISKAKYFVGFSALLLLVGVSHWISKGSLRYGVDFKGGTLVYVRFAERPQVDQIRQMLSARGLGSATIQEIRDITRPDANEVVIGLEQQGDAEQALDVGKTAILEALQSAYGSSEQGKPDLNAARPEDIAEVLARRDALALGVAAGERYNELGQAIARFRDSERGGLVTDFTQLRSVDGVTDGVVSALRDRFTLGKYAIRNVEIVGPKVGEALRRQAVVVTLYALAGMLVYIAFRFEWVYGAAAVVAVFHDVVITLGFFSLFQFEVSLTVIAAFLTLVGYSMNDTIVIFDRIRENLRTMRREPFEVVVNRSINQTLSRTVLTSGLTFITVLVLFLLGGEVLRGFAFAMVVGVVVGTYSTVGIAAPMVVFWYRYRGGRGFGAAPAVPQKGAV
jgi:preprotein translocase subunit SecF